MQKSCNINNKKYDACPDDMEVLYAHYALEEA